MTNVRFETMKDFLGARVLSLMVQAAIVGFLLFAIESSFILVIQGFMRTLGILEPGKWMLPAWYPDSIISSMVILVLFGIVRAGIQAYRYYLSTVTHQVFNRLQRERIIAYGLAHADETSTHEVVNVYNDLVTRAGSVLNIASQMVLVATSSVFLFLLGLKLAPIEMGLGILFLGIFLIPLRLLNRRIGVYGAGLTESSEAAGRILIQGLRHHFFLKIYGLIPLEIEKGVRSLRGFEEIWRRYQTLYALKSSVPLIAGTVVISAITYISVIYIHTPAVKLLGFFYVFIRLAQASSETSTTFSEIRVYLPGIKKLYAWYVGVQASRERAQPEKHLVRSADRTSAFLAEVDKNGVNVSLECVTFGYEGANELFRNFDLRVGLGETLVIQGESGTGKSTLLTLMLGIHSPSSGRVLINGFPVSEVRDLLSEIVAYVGPEPYLISGTVRENLLYGNRLADQIKSEELWEALRSAQLEQEIRALPGELGAYLLEHTQLSTGQKQRMAIARAILRRPKLLILDEASANLDKVTEENFIASIRSILKNLTTVIISHKPSFNGISTQRLELRR